MIKYHLTVVLSLLYIWREMDGGSEVVDDPADGLDVGVLRLPLVMTAVITSLHDVHAAAEVRLFIHHPPEDHRHTSHER